MLPSCEIFFDLLLDDRILLGDDLPCLTNTVFGWIVGGSSPSRPNSSLKTCISTVNTQEQNIDDFGNDSGKLRSIPSLLQLILKKNKLAKIILLLIVVLIRMEE